MKKYLISDKFESKISIRQINTKQMKYTTKKKKKKKKKKPEEGGRVLVRPIHTLARGGELNHC